MERFAFDKIWFTDHQKGLLWLANAPVIKYWFRWILRINKDCSFKEKISEVGPNFYKIDLGLHWTKDKGIQQKIRADFRTHNKFSKRLYHAFYPLWFLMHQWDSLIAEKFIPAWDLGFSTLTVFPDPGTGATTVDGLVGRTAVSDANWATIRAGSGNLHRATNATDYVFYIRGSGGTTWSGLTRFIATFDTSPLGAFAVISVCVTSIRGIAKLDPAAQTPDLNIYGATPAVNNDLADADFGNLLSTAFSTAITYANLSTSGYIDFTENASGIAAIVLTGITKRGFKNANFDAANVAPTNVNSDTDYEIDTADNAGTSADPKMVITYTGPINYTLTCDQGSYSLTGQAAIIGRSFVLTCVQGAYTLTGFLINLLYRQGYKKRTKPSLGVYTKRTKPAQGSYIKRTKPTV